MSRELRDALKSINFIQLWGQSNYLFLTSSLQRLLYTCRLLNTCGLTRKYHIDNQKRTRETMNVRLPCFLGAVITMQLWLPCDRLCDVCLPESAVTLWTTHISPLQGWLNLNFVAGSKFMHYAIPASLNLFHCLVSLYAVLRIYNQSTVVVRYKLRFSLPFFNMKIIKRFVIQENVRRLIFIYRIVYIFLYIR